MLEGPCPGTATRRTVGRSKRGEGEIFHRSREGRRPWRFSNRLQLHAARIARTRITEAPREGQRPEAQRSSSSRSSQPRQSAICLRVGFLSPAPMLLSPWEGRHEIYRVRITERAGRHDRVIEPAEKRGEAAATAAGTTVRQRVGKTAEPLGVSGKSLANEHDLGIEASSDSDPRNEFIVGTACPLVNLLVEPLECTKPLCCLIRSHGGPISALRTRRLRHTAHRSARTPQRGPAARRLQVQLGCRLRQQRDEPRH